MVSISYLFVLSDGVQAHNENHFVFEVEIIFLMVLRALVATNIGDNERSTACFFSLIFFSSDFSRSICVLLSVRLPRFTDVPATATVPLIVLLHGGCSCVHLVEVRLRFRQIIRGVSALIVVLSVHNVVPKTLPFIWSASVYGLVCVFRRSIGSNWEAFVCEQMRTWLVFRLLIRNGSVMDTVTRSHRLLSHKLLVTVFDRLRCMWLRWVFATGWCSSKQCEWFKADAAVILPLRCIEIDRDRFISSLLHFDEPQPVQFSASLVGYVLSLLLLLLAMAPTFRRSIKSVYWDCQPDGDWWLCCCCCSLIRKFREFETAFDVVEQAPICCASPSLLQNQRWWM